MRSSSGSTDRYPQPGDVLDGKYRIEGLVAEGGMGAVLKATHLLRRATVALKFLSGDARSHPGAEERFVNEAVAASRIDSDHIVKIFDVARLSDGSPYLVMEFLGGCDLDTLREREGPRLAVPRAVHFVLQVLRALQTAHAAGIVHRDMKPSNCFVINKDGEADFIKVIDFGISKVRSVEGARLSLTGTNTIFGTPLYMSPEQAHSSRNVDLRADLYSAGVILYELLSGRTPHSAETGTNILFKVWAGEPDALKAHCPELPDALAGAVHRALAREPGDRFGSAVEMAQALAPFADERSTSVLGWLLGSRGRSLVPAGFASVRPPDPGAVAHPSEGGARTLPGASAGQAERRTTDTGVAREPQDPSLRVANRGLRISAALAAVLAIVGSGAGLLATRHCASPDPSASTLSSSASEPWLPPGTAAVAPHQPPPAPVGFVPDAPEGSFGDASVAARAASMLPSARPSGTVLLGSGSPPPSSRASAPTLSSPVPNTRVRQSGLEEEFRQ
jgi:eukaryotic-like serine/threonine-protein kinase